MSEYHSDNFMVYHPISEVQKILGMKKKTDIFLDEYKVKLRKRGDNTLVQIELTEETFFGDILEGIAQVRSYLHPYLTDKESIERVLTILEVKPESEFFQDILSDLQSGDPLSFKMDQAISEVEDRVANPDPQVLDLIEKAKAMSPKSKFVGSLENQFRGGFELSDRQLEVLNDIANPQVNQTQLDMLNDAISSNPRNNFLRKLKSVVEGGRSLSQKQLDVVNKILSPQVQPTREDLLEDLLANGSYLTKDDYKAIRSALKGGYLDETQRSRMRHLIYKNVRRLQNSYSKDDVRSLLKKAFIKRVANLHMMGKL